LRKDFLGLGQQTPGLERFPFERPDAPDRIMNPQENLVAERNEENLSPDAGRAGAGR
jgi:hypothetical protein